MTTNILSCDSPGLIKFGKNRKYKYIFLVISLVYRKFQKIYINKEVSVVNEERDFWPQQ